MQAAANTAKTTVESKYWDSVFDLRTYHVAAISFLEGTVKNALLYWCPLIIYSLVSLLTELKRSEALRNDCSLSHGMDHTLVIALRHSVS